jgi:hypothetical protein
VKVRLGVAVLPGEVCRHRYIVLQCYFLLVYSKLLSWQHSKDIGRGGFDFGVLLFGSVCRDLIGSGEHSFPCMLGVVLCTLATAQPIFF